MGQSFGVEMIRKVIEETIREGIEQNLPVEVIADAVIFNTHADKGGKMNKQEKISDELKSIIEDAMLGKHDEGDVEDLVYDAKKRLSKLGVVIKVEGELPNGGFWSFNGRDGSEQVYTLPNYHLAQKEMLKAGYKLTKPLI